MNKKFTFSAILSLITLISLAQCPIFFKRNNGNGTCGSQSEIRMYFAASTTNFPPIDSIYSNGIKTNATMVSINDSKFADKGYVSYCFNGNLPTAKSLQIFFHYGSQGTGAATNTGCLTAEGSVAPILLSNFAIQRSSVNTNAVTINWETQQELNASGFEIQRSADNITYETIAVVPSKNSSTNAPQFYSFTDNSNNFNQVSYYRIKMIDKDNTYTLSAIKTVKASNSKSDFTVFPNPSIGNAKITITDLSEPTNVIMLDNSGRVVKQATLTNSNSVELNNLQKGSYFIKIVGKVSGTTSVKKLSVIN